MQPAWLASVVLIAATGCAFPTPDTPAPPAPTIRQVQVGGSGAGRTLRWTCEPGRVCSEQMTSASVVKPVSAPVGSTVIVEVAGKGGLPTSCWIADGSGQLAFVKDSGVSQGLGYGGARCEYHVE